VGELLAQVIGPAAGLLAAFADGGTMEKERGMRWSVRFAVAVSAWRRPWCWLPGWW
jgi:hypothetical protein